jgi:hypothetical protein
MSMESPQQKAASETSAWQAALAQQLAGVALPELQGLMGGRSWVVDTPATAGTYDSEGNYTEGTPEKGHWATTQGSLTSLLAGTQGGTQKSALDEKAYQSALGQLNQGYAQQGMVSREALGYQGLRSGEARRSPGAMTSSLGQTATALERDRQTALQNLNFQSAQSSMADYNKLLQLMGQGTQTALGLGAGFSGASGSALAGLSQVSPGASAMGGAATGASLGATIGSAFPLLGTAIGGIAGGLIGGVGGYAAGSNP